MKSFFVLSCLVRLALAASTLSGAVIRVDNKDGSSADYGTLQAAIDAAVAGDTIYIAGSADSYGFVLTTKRLDFVGPGYLLGQNTNDTANLLAASAYFTFNAGSEDSSVTGMEFNSAVTMNAGRITMNAGCIRERSLFRQTTVSFLSVTLRRRGGVRSR